MSFQPPRAAILAATLAILAPAAALSEDAGIPSGCALQATVVMSSCETRQLLTCANKPAGFRQLDIYEGGVFRGTNEMTGGLFMTGWRRGAFVQTIEVAPGTAASAIALAPDARLEVPFTRTRAKLGTEYRETVTGTRTLTAHGPTSFDLADGSSRDGLQFEDDLVYENGEAGAGTLIFDAELGLVLSQEFAVTLPDGTVQTGADTVVALIGPGDPGFGQTTPPEGVACTVPE